MKVSVIVPVFRDYDRLRLTLDCLVAQDYEGPYEIIVADNGTPDEELQPVERQREPQIHWVCEPRNGSYAARNAALQVANGEYLAFTDADCLPARSWLSAGIAALEESGAGLVAGRIELVPRNPARLTAAEIWELQRGFPQEHYANDLHFGATANAFTTRAIVEEVGPFHETLRSGGDREFGERVHDHGHAVIYCDYAVVKHPTRDQVDALMRKTVRTTKGDLERQELRGELGATKRVTRGLEAAWKLATPAVTAARAAWSFEGEEGRATYAAVETLVRTRKEWEILRWLVTGGD